MKKIYYFFLLLCIGALAYPITANAQLNLTVADGTATNEYVPIYGYYADSYLRCQVVYPAADLAGMAGGTINSLTFYLSSTASGSWGSANFHVRLGSASESTISAFYPSSSLTEVYAGSLDGTQSTMTITFTTPYVYTGGDLLLEVTNEVIGSYKRAYFYGISASNASVQGYNYSSLSGVTASQSDFIPKTTFNYLPGGDGPMCFDPTGLTVSGETTDGATVSWTAPAAGDAPQGYEVCVLPADATFDAATANWVTATGTSHTFTGLNSSTKYTAHVRSVCGSDFYSNGNANVNFTTKCTAITSFPWTENFNSLTSGIPDCWDNSEGSVSDNSYKWNYYATGQEGAGLRFDSYNASTGQTNMLKTPVLDLSALTTPQLTFGYKNPSGGDFSVYLSTDGGNTYTTEIATGLTGVGSWADAEYTLDTLLANVADKSRVVIVFKGTSNWGYNDAYIYLDNVTVGEAPTCFPPTGLHASVTSDEATIGWTEVSGNHLGYQAEWDGSVLPGLSGNPFSLTGLTPNTSYTVRVRTVCAAGDTSNWSAPYTFTTDCTPVTAFPYYEGFDNSTSIPACWKAIDGDGDGNNWYIWDVSSEEEEPGSDFPYTAGCITSASYDGLALTPNNWLLSPQFTLPSPCNLSLVWYAKSQDPSYLEPLDILMSTTGGDTAAFTTTVMSLNAVPGEHTQYVYSLANYAGQTVRFAFVHRNVTDQFRVNLDDVSILEIPQVVTNDATALATATATLNGSVTGQGMTAYGFEWKATADSEYERDTVSTGDHTGSISFNLANLDPNTSYTFRTFAAVGIYIYYGDEKTFTTEQLPCPAPANLTVADINTESARLTWASQLPTTGSYNVYLNNTLLTQTPVSELTYLLTGLTPGTSYEVTVAMVCNGTEGPSETRTFSTPCIREGIFAIGDTNSTLSYYYLPLNTYYNYSYTQQLFLASEMGRANIITNIAFNLVNTASATMQNVKIYLGHTTKNEFASTTDTVPFSALTEVYSGDLNFSPGWNTFELDQPFAYNGNDNLVLALFDNVSGYPGSQYKFLCASTGNNYLALDYYSDSQIPNPTSLTSYTSSKSRRQYHNVVKFGYCDNSTCVPPTVSVNNLTANDAEVTWTPGYQESAWGMQYKGRNDNDWTTVTLTPNSPNPYALSNLTSNTAYTLRMWSICGDNELSDTAETTFTTLISCPVPTSVDVNNVTATMATLTWTAGGNESAWDLYISSSSTDVPDATTTPMYSTSATSYTIPSLTENTVYTAYMRANCGDGDVSEWVSKSFTTPCTSVSVPYTENFDSYTQGIATGTSFPTGYPAVDMPSCWTFLNRVTTTTSYPLAFLSSSSSYAVSGNCLFFKSSSITPLYAVLPMMSENLNELQLTFTYRNESVSTSNGTLHVGYMTDPADASTFVEMYSCPQTATQTEVKVPFDTVTVFPGSPYYIVFQYVGGIYSNYYLSIDNVSVDYIPNCIAPTGLATSNVTTDGVTLTWTAGGSESAWDLYISSSSTDVPDATTTPMYSTSATSYTFSGLTGNTAYTAYVRANCGGEQSSWVSANFRTDCGSVSVPYTVDFESASTLAALPDCWKRYNTYSTSTDYPYTVSNYSVSGSRSLYFYSSSTTYALAALPSIDMSIPQMSDLMVSFSMRPASVNARMIVGVMSDPNDPTTFVPVDTVQNTEASVFEQHKVLLTNYIGSGRYVALKNYNTGGSYSIYVDDVVVDMLSCFDIMNPIVSNVTATSATVAWTAGGNETAWDLYLSSSAADVPDATSTPMYSITATSYTFSGLTDNTAYKAYVRANCGGSDVSDWVSVAFTTLCNPVSVPYTENFDSYASGNGNIPDCWTSHSTYSPGYPYINGNYAFSGSNSLYFYTSGSTYNLAVLPEVNLGALSMSDLRVIFTMNPSDVKAYMVVGVMTDPEDPTTFEPVDTVQNALPSTFEQHKVLLTQYTGNGRYVALKNLNIDGYYSIYLDDVVLEQAPSCMEPENLTVMEVSSETATLSWTTNDISTGYTVEYSSDNGNTWTTASSTVTASPYTITNLAPRTHYDVRVFATCGSETSNASYTSVTTQCVLQGDLSIGTVESTTSSNIPFSNQWNYSLSEQLFTADELGNQPNNLSAVSFYCTSNYVTDRDWDIYLISVPSSTTTLSSFVALNSGSMMDTVFSGAVRINNGWITVNFDKEYPYDGSSNLILVVDDNTGSYNNSIYFATNEYPGGAVSIRSDNTNYDPIAMSGYSPSVNVSRNVVTFTYCNDMGVICPIPVDITASNVTATTAEVSWTAPNTNFQALQMQYKPANGLAMSTETATIDFSQQNYTNAQSLDGENVNLDNYISFVANKSTGSTEPAYYTTGSALRIYGNNNLVVTATNGAHITGIEIEAGSSYHPNLNYVVDDGQIQSINGTSTHYEIPNLLATTVTFTNPSNTQLRMESLTVHYTLPGDGWVNVENPVSPEVLTNLTPETEYMVRMRTVCDVSDTSVWSDILRFTTADLCQTPTALAVVPTSNSAEVTWTPAEDETSWNVQYRPVVPVAGDRTLEYVFADHSSDITSDSVMAGFNMDENIQLKGTKDGGTTNPALSSDKSELRLYYANNTTHNGCYITLTPSSNAVITGLEVVTSGNSYTPTVNYTVDGGTATAMSRNGTTYTLSGIQAQNGLKIQNVNSTNTQLRITKLTVYYTLSADTSWHELAGGVTSPAATLTGLASNTEYSVRVRANCGNDAASDWVSTDFTTLCGVMVPPYSENFDNTNGTLPDCWTNFNEVGSTNWAVTSSFHGNVTAAHSGSNVMQFFQNGNGSMSSAEMPTFDLSGMSNPTLKFWFTNQKWISDQDVLEIYYRTSPTDVWTLLATYDNNVSDWAKDSLLLPNPSATYQIKFKANSNYGYGINIDDVSIEEGPNCFVPQNLIASNVTDDGATISWTPGNTETAWDIYLSSDASIVPDATTTPLATATTTSYTFTSLTALTPYMAYVRANCGDGDVTEWISVDFIPGTYNMKVSGWDTLHTCGIVVYDDGGTNNNYSNNCNSYLVIYPDALNHYAQVSGTIIAESSRYDSLIIYDGAGITTPLYVSNHNSTATSNIPTITSTTGPLTIHFISDYSNNYAGFELTVGCICKVTNEFSVTACESYTWNNEVYTASGDYEQTLPTATGCDSVVTLHLTIHNPTHASFTETACGSYTWVANNNTEYTQSGTYTYSHQDANGCTQVDTLHLTINPIPVVTITGDAAIALFESATLTASGAATYVWSAGETTPSITVTPPSIGSHTYTVTGTSEYNCVSVPVSFTVEVGACRPGVSTETVTACDSYTWHGVTYTQSTNNATYRIPEGAASGCDSVITLHLTILNKVLNEFSASNCISYEWNGQTYTSSGDYTQTFPAANGCDSVVTLHLTIKQPVTKTVNIVDCDSYTWIDQTYTTSGDYTRTFTAANGCDSIVTLHLTIKNHVTQEITASDCGSYTWNNEVYEASGDYEQIFTAANGCDSVVTLHLTINPEYDLALEQSICKAALPYSWRDTVFAIGTETGTYVFHRQTVAGCDSTVTLHLIVNDAIATEVTETGCDSYTWNNQVYTTSGDYVQTLQTAAGCDSTVTMHLTIYSPVHEAVTVVNCGPYQWNNAEYAQSGTYTYSHEDAHGCTQVDTLHLTVKPVPVVTITPASGMPIIAYGESETLTASGADSYVWNTQETTPSITVAPRITTTYSVVGTTDGCESESVSITVNVGNCTLITSEFTATGCGRYTWNGTVYEQSGDYQQLLVNDLGCDSLVTLHLTIYPNSGVAQSVNACGSYLWYHQNLTESGTYTFAYYDGNGCIQEDTLYLTINHPVNESLNIVSCGPYMWNNTEYTQDGTYTYTHEDAHGCTQVDTLRLTIKPVPVVTVSSNNTQIVQHESTTLTASGATSYVWSNQATGATVTVTPMQTTTYSVVGTVDGCASEPATITVEVTPCTPAEGVFTVTACDRYVWYGTTYTESTNTATHAIQRPGMCDSIVTLHLTILHPVAEIINITACERYTWHNTTFTQSGRYTYSHQDANGCTQVDTLYLTILRPTHTAVTVSECNGFVWHNIEYTQSGTYTFAFADVNGCTQVDTLHLTIFHPAHTAYNVDACGSYIWNNTEYTQSGTYTYRHRDANGCQQIDTLHLTIHHPVAQSYEAVACESYTWNNTVYTQSGTYTYAHEDAHGCMQVDTLRLTIHNAVAESFEAEACESYTWNNTVYTQSGIYTYAHADANGCTQVDTLHLTIYNAVAEVYEAEACESYTWNNTEYTQSGTYTYTHEDIHGCTQVDTLHLIINNPTHMAVTESACGSYTWNNTEYTQSGTYTFAHADANGCTQVDTLHLTIFQPATTEFSDNACGSYYWNNVYYNESGDYVQHFQTVEGCDSTVTLHLTIYPRAEVVSIVGDTLIHEYESATLTATALNGNPFWVGFGQTSSITVAPMTTTTYTVMAVSEHCASAPVRVTVTVLPCIPVQGVETITACESFEWHGVTYTESTNTPTFTIERQGVCDSVVTLHLTIFNPTHVAYTESACGSYVWNNTEYTQSGTYTYTHTDVNGCTQVDTLHLTINNPVAATYEAEACGSYTWNNTEYTQSGTYTFAHLDANGCTQVDTLHLTIHNAVAEVFEAEACGSYTWNNTEYTQSGTYTFAHTDAHGCTQVDTLHLTILNAVHEAFTVSECNAYTWHGTTYTQSGTYTFIHSDANGCTKVDTLHLTVFHPQPDVMTITSCGDFAWYGTVYTQSGVYTHPSVSPDGCDQVDTLYLTVNRPQNTSSTAEACGSYMWRGNTYTQSGVYLKAVQDNFGCMYLDTLYLTIHQPLMQIVEATACESYTWNNVTYTQSGHYVQHFQTTFGCDSTVTLNLTVKHPQHQSVTAGECGSYTWHGATYTASGVYTYVHSDANGCTQVDTLHLIIYQPIHQSLRITECESFTWGGTTYTQSGVYTYAHPDNHGCTQVDTLYLTINHPTGTSLTVSECGMYDWNGFIYTQSGTYTQSHLDANGCTQVDTLRLTIYHPVHQSVTVTECFEYTWHGTTYTQSGTYTYVHTDNHGCTQVDTLHLTIHHPQSSTITVDACGSYQWYGTNYTQSGVYTHNVTGTYGCQVKDTLILHIHQPVSTQFSARACSYYVWDGTVYTQSGDYVKHYYTQWGCDSTVTLHLDIHQPQSSEFTIVTENSCYTWNGIEYCQNGTYMQQFEDSYGCDSVVTLHLTLRVGVEDYDGYAVSLYPNPTTGVAYVEVSGDEMERVEVYDSYGKMLQTRNVSGNVAQIELSAYAKGVYHVRVTTTKGVVTKRVVKN